MNHDIDLIRRRLGSLAWILDSAIQIPGTRFRIGVDALLGLIPGVGDALGVLLSAYIVREAARAGAPPSVLARMAFNVAVEGVVGIVPIAGDVFDAAWKANQRNVALLERYIENPRREKRASRAYVAMIIIGLIAFIALTVAAAVAVMRLIWNAVAG